MVFCPVMISSTKPFISPSFTERWWNRGRTFLVMYRVKRMDMGMVMTNTSTRVGEITTIIMKEPTTVMTLAAICSKSLEREAFTVSMS